MGNFGKRIGAGRGDNYYVSPQSKLDMVVPFSCVAFLKFYQHRIFGQRRQRQGRYKIQRGGSHDYFHLCFLLHQQSYQMRCLVCSDASGDAQQDFLALQHIRVPASLLQHACGT